MSGNSARFYEDLREERVLRESLKLPVLDSTAMELEWATSQTELDIDRIVGLIQRDPGLVAALLRIANSAYYGFRQELRSVSETVRVLGAEPVRRIGIAFYTRALYPEDNATAKTLWLNCAAAGIAAQEIARRAQFDDPEVLGTAGVLHDIGKLVLLANYGEAYVEFLRTGVPPGPGGLEQELGRFEGTHTSLGGLACRSWGILGKACAGACFHHGWPQDVTLLPTDGIAASVVAWADALAHKAFGGAPPEFAPEVREELDRLQLSERVREELSEPILKAIHDNVDDYV